jgi:predicted metallo-beta-lactamase superfamily hydrolase
MEVVPVGEESLGVRSMCLYVETRDVRILFDASACLRILGSWRGPERCGP